MKTSRLYSILFLLLLALPFLQRQTRIFPEPLLNGVESAKIRPSLSAASWFSGTYAKEFEDYFSSVLGFRGLMVKLHNQFRASLFNDIRRDKGTRILLGKDNWLFEGIYTDFLAQNPSMSHKQLEGFSQLLAKVQTQLAEQGILFFFIISPSKAEIYKEKLPESFLATLPPKKGLTNRERLIPLLQQQGVHYLDSHDQFMQIKPDADLLFAPGGTHWNYYGSFLVCRELITRINENNRVPLPVPELKAVKRMQARGTDQDLTLLLNLLWFSSDRSATTPYPEVAVQALEIEQRPDILMVGDSFAFTLIDAMYTAKIANHIDLLYYNKRRFSYTPTEGGAASVDHTKAEIGPINPKQPDWNSLLPGKKIIIVEINEIFLKHGSWDFLQHLVTHLDRQPSGQ
jgi:hypothetical protein